MRFCGYLGAKELELHTEYIEFLQNELKVLKNELIST